jgi:amino acid adenylation domain-containing protein
MAQRNVQLAFCDAAERFAEVTAIEHQDRRISYAELERNSNRLCHFLRDAGVKRGDAVAILADDTVIVVTAILGVLKAGAAFVPLDPRLPPARLEAMLAVARPALILADDGTGPLLARIRPEIAGNPAVAALGGPDLLDGQLPGWSIRDGHWTQAPDTSAIEPMGPDDFSYIYFTSGSTGQPKGIAGRLKGIDHFTRWEIDTFGVGPGSRISQLTTPSFDAFLRDVFTPLCAGGTVCVPGDRLRTLSPGNLSPWVAASGINLMHCVPTVFRLMLNDLPGPDAFPDLRWVLLAGEPLTPTDVGRWMDTVGDRIGLVNLYGPSETTMTKFFHRVTRSDATRRSVPIGQPMPGARAVIVDERKRPYPAGAIGEILIRTPYRTLGYHGRPDLTSQVFVPNPFSEDPQDIVYRTGDLGRVLEGGDFELIGRKDQQVKIRGLRVELGEIEDSLRRHPSVADAAVVVLDGGRTGRRSARITSRAASRRQSPNCAHTLPNCFRTP